MKITTPKKNNYFSLSNATAQDTTISFEALGMLTYLLSKPNNWIVQPKDLQKRFNGKDKTGKHKTTGKHKVYRIINELIDAGYLIRNTERDETGQFKDISYDVYDKATAIDDRKKDQEGSPFPENRDTDNPDAEKPDAENRDITKERVVQSTEVVQKTPIVPAQPEPLLIPETVTPVGGLDFKAGDRVETPKAGHGTITAVNRDTITVTLDSGRTRDFMPDILTRSTQPAPASATHPGASLITAFIETTNAAKTGVDTKTNRGIADDLAGKGITPENIKAYLEHIASQEWRSNKIPSWFSMAKDLPAWVEESIATVKANEARREQQEREQEERLAKLNAPPQVTAEQLLELKAYRRKVFSGDVDELKDSA